MTLGITLVGGPTALLEIGGLRLLTDPTFDPPGDFVSGSGNVLTKTEGPALGPDELGPIDAVLLSHDQHADNLDTSGRKFLESVPLTLTTPSGAARLGARGLRPWEETSIGALRVTAVPAQHGPDGAEPVTGEVTGFLLQGNDVPTVYVSGDNASLDVVRSLASRASVDVAVLFAGGARTALFDGAPLTLTSADAAAAASILSATVVPLHFRGWSHFAEDASVLQTAFADAGVSDRLVVPTPGQRVAV